MNRPVFIFDIDGVLVNPRGYRKASQATLDHFTQRIGIGTVLLTDEILNHFEAHNISSEFDIVPLCLAEIFNEILTLYPDIKLPADLYQSCDQLYKNKIKTPRLDLPSLAEIINKVLVAGQFPSEAALKANYYGAEHAPFINLCSHPLLNSILENTRNVKLSPVTNIFQQFVLGSEIFQDTYKTPSEIKTNSFLHDFDQPQLEKEIAELLLELWNKGNIDMAAFTGRPSAPADGNNKPLLPYSPEANMALDITGLSSIPLLGLGEVYRLADLTSLNSDSLGKPSLISSLGAISAALCRNGFEGLLAAHRYINLSDDDFFRHVPALDIHLFEDTPSAIRSTREAVDMLTKIGASFTLHVWGIASSADKVRSLQAAGAITFESINNAIIAALKIIKTPGYV
ncbi:MAG: hypothetical protein GYA34_11010 [Chloroflexi bacterium]|nr:hypothetical protein [Chloroflexota bacterium]